MAKFLPSVICVMCLLGFSIQAQTYAKQKVEVTKSDVAIQTDAQQNWSIDSINKSTWSGNLGRGQFPVYARAQVMLNNLHASPGAIDGKSGKNFLKALAAYQQIQALPVTGELDKQTWDSLLKNQKTAAFGAYQITTEDIKGPYVKSIPRNYALQSKMRGLYYTRVTEMLGEKFHIDEDFLKQINPTYAVIMAGKNNSYGLPKQKILDRLTKIGAKVYRTDEEGTIMMISNGNNIEVKENT